MKQYKFPPHLKTYGDIYLCFLIVIVCLSITACNEHTKSYYRNVEKVQREINKK